MVSMDRKDGDGNVDIGILVVDVREGTFKNFGGVGEELERAWPVAYTVLSESSHDLVEGLAGRLIFVEEIAGEKNHVDLYSDMLITGNH
jgi:hypothetical protein